MKFSALACTFALSILLPLTVMSQTSTNQALPFDKLWDYSKPAETEAKFRGVLPQVEACGDLDQLLQLLTQIARTQGLQRKFADAHATLDSVKFMMEGRKAEAERAEIRYELERGRVFNSSKEKEAARPHFTRALDLAILRGEDNLAVDAAHMLGIVETGDAALKWNVRAVELAEAADDPKAKGWLGALYNNIGWTYHDMGRYNVALDYFERDLEWYEEHNATNQAEIAKWSIAKMHRLLGDAAKAYDLQLALKQQKESRGASADGYLFEELGECAAALNKDATERTQYFKQAYDLLREDAWFMANETARATRLKELSED